MSHGGGVAGSASGDEAAGLAQGAVHAVPGALQAAKQTHPAGRDPRQGHAGTHTQYSVLRCEAVFERWLTERKAAFFSVGDNHGQRHYVFWSSVRLSIPILVIVIPQEQLGGIFFKFSTNVDSDPDKTHCDLLNNLVITQNFPTFRMSDTSIGIMFILYTQWVLAYLLSILADIKTNVFKEPNVDKNASGDLYHDFTVKVTVAVHCCHLHKAEN